MAQTGAVLEMVSKRQEELARANYMAQYYESQRQALIDLAEARKQRSSPTTRNKKYRYP